MTVLLLWLLAGIIPAAIRAALWVRAAFRNPRRLTFLDRPVPRLRARFSSSQRPEGPAPTAQLPGAGLPPRAHGGAGELRTPLAVTGHETGARRPRRRRERGQHRAGPLRIDLATTDTIPRLTTPDRPPWTTQPFPEVTP